MKTEKRTMGNELVNITKVTVRFSEIDALGIVWHGHYLTYMEDGRESFGKQFSLEYLDFYRNALLTPLVNINIDFKRTVKFGDNVIIETTYIDSPAAKIIFHYKITRESDNEIVATGESTQVFMNFDHELLITMPEFFTNWKKKNGLAA
jgi:acyl-CoA thioester hydrolase